MVTVVGTVPLQVWLLPLSSPVKPVGMVNVSTFNVCSFCHKLDKSHLLEALGDHIPVILYWADVQVACDQGWFCIVDYVSELFDGFI